MRNRELLIHQALHGYVEGHTQVQSSVQLKPRDAKAVLIYSDTASSGLRMDDGGYLTGYPLQDSAYYAIARTWPAPEMKRPGAVWTHTLLIEFPDVALIADAGALVDLFKRPNETRLTSDVHHYGVPIEFDNVSSSPHRSWQNLIDETWYRQLVASLYGYPGEPVVASTSASERSAAEHCVLEIWSQQWSRLRRSFRFCTLTSADRSTDRVVFDLQLIPANEPSARSRFKGALFTRELQDVQAPWIDHLLDDMLPIAGTRLREFLQRAGADISMGRRAMVPLTKLHLILTNEGNGSHEWAEAISLAASMSEGSVPNVVGTVLGAALRSVGALDSSTFEILLRHLDLVDPNELRRSGEAVGVAAWGISPECFMRLHRSSPSGKEAAEAGIRMLNSDVIAKGLASAEDHHLFRLVADLRPELICSSDVWRHGQWLARQALSQSRYFPNAAPAALIGLLRSNLSTLIPEAFDAFGSEAVWGALVTPIEPAIPDDVLGTWLHYGVRYQNTVAAVLASGVLTARGTLLTIARATDPDHVPNDYGDDPWILALRSTPDSLAAGDQLYLDCYLVARALGSRSRSSSAILEGSFHAVYEAVGQNLDSDMWALLQPRVPRGDESDKRRRLAAGVAQTYVRKDLPADSFCRLGQTKQSFSDLIKAAAGEWGGKSFLRNVRQEARGSRRSQFDPVKIIEDALDRWF